MLLKSPSISSFEDDPDEELPCVTLSQSTQSKSELEMPPASEVASLRAREDAAERALQDLRDSCNDPLLISLSRSTSQGSSGEEGEAALSARVSALQVTEQSGTRGINDRLQLLTAMRDNLPEESAILNEYIRVLKEKPGRADAVTECILRGTCSSLISGRIPSDIGVSLCLLCVALRGPRGHRARGALHALLDARPDVSVLATAISAAVEDAEQLLAAHDAARNGARRGADRLAAALLARAMARALQQDSSPNTEPPAPLSSESVALVRASWRKLPTRAQLSLLRCAGRALAAVGDMGYEGDTDTGDIEGMSGMDTEHKKPEIIVKTECMAAEDAGGTKATETLEGSKTEDTATREAEREGGAALLAALSQPLPRASAFHIDRQQVLTNVSKLQLLFRSRFVSDSENDTFVETHFNCSQISMDSIDTPIKLDTPIKEETPTKQESSMWTPRKEIKVRIPMKLVTPMRLENPIKMTDKLDTTINDFPIKDPSINDLPISDAIVKSPPMTDPPINDSPMKGPSMNDLLINNTIVKGPQLKDPLINDSRMKGPSMNDLPINNAIVKGPPMKDPPMTPVKGMKAGTQLKLDGFFKQITPVKLEKEDEIGSPDRKRIRRELPQRRCAHRSGKS